MSCKFTEQVSYLIDGELPEAESRVLERHLVQCVECQQVRADFLNLRSQISSFESSVTPEVQRRALEKILGKSATRARPRWEWSFGPAAAFAVVILVALIVGVFYLNRGSSVEPSQVVASASPSPVSTASPAESPRGPSAEDKPKDAAPAKDNDSPMKPGRKLSPTQPKRAVPAREPKPGEQFAAVEERVTAVDPQSMTAAHFEKIETLLRSFRNLRVATPNIDVAYEKKRAKQLVYQNMILRREADASGDVQSATLLESVEPILLDIANLSDKTDNSVVRVINERVQRKNIVAQLQVNSAALAKALD